MLLVHLVLSTDDEFSVVGMEIFLVASLIIDVVFSSAGGGVDCLKSKQVLAAAVAVAAVVELRGRWV